MNAIAPRARGPRGPKPGDPRTREERDYHDAVRLLARLTSMALTLDASVQRARGREPGPLEGGGCVDYDLLHRSLEQLLPQIHQHTRRLP